MVQVLSQNGWPARATTSSFTRFTAAGMSGWAANADVAVIFSELVARFNAEVEPVAGPVLDDWSWANRLVRGSSSEVSNHGSATAVDINAIHHPRGVRNTFTHAQVVAVRAILGSITTNSGRPILRWGHDYVHAPVDEMHFEINDDAVHAKQAADKIRARKPEETDMQDTDLITLTEDAARWMSAAPGAVQRKTGDKVSVSYLLQWGGAGLARSRAEVAVLAARVSSLESKVNALGGVVHPVSGTVGVASGTTPSA